ncbi:Nn.00g056760.m01.CDS01 [Neocucurbitaria sp. VM-36]
MSGFRGRGRGGGGGGALKTLKGAFVNGVWQCDCNPRVPAVHLQVKKNNENKGKWFRTCQKSEGERCGFFLWDDHAQPREAAALANNSRTEPDRAHPNVNPNTPSRRQPSPPPPYTIQSEAAGPSRKRTRSISDNVHDDYDLGQADEAFNDELNQVMAQVETPSKAAKTTNFATPVTTRRKLPWQMGQSHGTSAYGLETPQTDRRHPNDPFASRPAVSGGSLFTPSKMDDDEAAQTATPSSSFETPTPNRFQDVVADDLVRDVFGLLQEAQVRLGPQAGSDLRSMLLKHVRSAEGYKRGRDVIRATVKAKDAKIAELTYRVNTLEAELEAEKAMVKHLQWEAQDESPDN